MGTCRLKRVGSADSEKRSFGGKIRIREAIGSSWANYVLGEVESSSSHRTSMAEKARNTRESDGERETDGETLAC